jgi:hypothetical protein
MAQIGFLNPWLYGPGMSLNNIGSGSDPGRGFSATKGWDAVSQELSPTLAH